MHSAQSIRCLIIEDEPIAQDLLIDYLDRIPSLQLVGAAMNVQQALQLCHQERPDLLLLDIHLPKFSGFDLLELIPKPVPYVIVTSAYREYALKGYEYAVIDFLEKPFEFDRFSLAVQRVEQRAGFTRRDKEQVETGDEVKLTKKVLSVRVDRNVVNIPLDSINFIESLDNYVKIHLIDQPSRPVVTKGTISKLETTLPPQLFVRINRSYIVRIDQIHLVTSASVSLFSGDELPIGVTYRDPVRQALSGSET